VVTHHRRRIKDLSFNDGSNLAGQANALLCHAVGVEEAIAPHHAAKLNREDCGHVRLQSPPCTGLTALD
jgi:hypothetical protein